MIRRPHWRKRNQCIMNDWQSTSISGKHHPENLWGGVGVGVIVIALSMCPSTRLARSPFSTGHALAHRESLCRHGWVYAGATRACHWAAG